LKIPGPKIISSVYFGNILVDEDRILTLNPEGKMGVNISSSKYDTMRTAIIDSLKEH
jgi:hypothetical protein